MVVRSPKGDKNTRGKILLKFSVYYSIFKTLFWFLNSYLLQLLKILFLFSPGGRQREKPGHVLFAAF